MGLHMPGAAFIPPDSELRDELTRAATTRAAALSSFGSAPSALADIVDEKSIINGMIGLLATGGSTNHTLHLPAIARAAGVLIDWKDFDDLSKIIPLLAKVYPNGQADVNHFHAAGGIGFVATCACRLRRGGALQVARRKPARRVVRVNENRLTQTKYSTVALPRTGALYRRARVPNLRV